MGTFIIRRLLWSAVILFIVTLVVFFAMRLLPGDPLIIFLGQSQEIGNLSQEQLDSLRAEYGLDKPILIQYVSWIGGVLRGDLGTSIYYREKVSTLMFQRFPVTLHLGLTAFVLSTFVGIFLGLIAAVRRGKWIDVIATVLANIGICIPVFWLGLLMMYVFGLRTGWIPIFGYTSPFDDFWLSTKQAIMPVICLSITGVGFIGRQTRSSMLEVIRQDYIRTAWSKGLKERAIIMTHALKNSLIPVITLLGIGVGMVFGGSVLVETIFAIPGVGRLLVTSIFAQDYVVIQSGTLIIATIIVLSNLIVDISYGWFDPRIRFG
jgi:peptide/nickel transport system permease protein